MKSSIFDYLPDFLPDSEVTSTDSIQYISYEKESGGFVSEDRYSLSKSPITKIVTVTATVDGSETELVEGTDFELVDSSAVKFLDGERPDRNTEFTVTYVSDSIIGRVSDSVEDEIEQRDEKLGIGSINDSDSDTIVRAKYIRTADGEELDEIGKIFGDLGRRAGRDDERYRSYLSSIAKVYNGRGTKSSIANAVSTVVSSDTNKISVEDVSFKEYFSENEYSILFDEFESNRISLLYDVAELADPSGVRFVGPIYNTGDNVTTIEEGPPVKVADSDIFDDPDNIPDNYIDPVAPKQTINLDLEIFDDSITLDKIPPWDFEWAHQKTSSVTGADGGDWNKFQWGEDSWDSADEIQTTITGDEWEFCDWNRIASQGTFGPYSDSVSLSDRTSSTISDKSPSDSTAIDDGLRVRFLVGTEDIGSNDSVTSDIESNITNTLSVNDSTTNSVTELWGAAWNQRLQWS